MTATLSDLKIRRAAAKRTFSTVFNQLIPLLKITGGNANASDLISKSEKSWETLEQAHENYAAATDESNTEDSGETEDSLQNYYKENHDKLLLIRSYVRVFNTRLTFHSKFEEYDYKLRSIKTIIDQQSPLKKIVKL